MVPLSGAVDLVDIVTSVILCMSRIWKFLTA
jgi:hypothetical protein